MAVKVITDSTADLSPEIIEDLGIGVVPVYVRFGNEVFRDGTDITKEALYRRLVTSSIHPTTAQPSPQDFATSYSECAEEADGIISIHVSAKTSGTCNSALQAREMVKGECPVEVVDSQFASVGLGMVVIAAARLARAGESLSSVLEETRRVISQVRMLGLFDTLKYLVLGGRVSKATTSVARILNIKPLFTFREGELVRAGLVRTYAQGVAKLYQFAHGASSVQELAIAHSTTPDAASRLKEQLRAIFPDTEIRIAQLGAGLGVHGGPGVLVVAVR